MISLAVSIVQAVRSCSRMVLRKPKQKRRHDVLLYLKVRGHSQKVQADIILESDIICCTLSTSGGCLLESVFFRQGLDPFSCVIVDEVSKAIRNYSMFHL